MRHIEFTDDNCNSWPLPVLDNGIDLYTYDNFMKKLQCGHIRICCYDGCPYEESLSYGDMEKEALGDPFQLALNFGYFYFNEDNNKGFYALIKDYENKPKYFSVKRRWVMGTDVVENIDDVQPVKD